MSTRASLILSVLLLITSPGPARATRCPGMGLSFEPQAHETLALEGWIVLQAQALAQPLALEATRARPELRGGGETVPMRVHAVYAGKQIAQAVLVPARRLKPRTRYTLHLAYEAVLANRKGTGTESWVREWTRTLKPPTWTTAAAADAAAPVWSSAPVLRGTSYERETTAGPLASAGFLVPVTDLGIVLVRVDVRPHGQNVVPASYLVRPQRGWISIGDRPCHGTHRLSPGRRYLATFEALDLSGNRAAAPLRHLEFSIPR
jgi:hypothetical protein